MVHSYPIKFIQAKIFAFYQFHPFYQNKDYKNWHKLLGTWFSDFYDWVPFCKLNTMLFLHFMRIKGIKLDTNYSGHGLTIFMIGYFFEVEYHITTFCKNKRHKNWHNWLSCGKMICMMGIPFWKLATILKV